MSKRLQVFVSSTYLDLRDERQTAVQAILQAGHIPAGMELFAAGDESQLATIRRWIDDSDVLMLVLGGRYGTIHVPSGCSYTELEYRYAIEKGKPVFALVMSDSRLAAKSTTADEVCTDPQHSDKLSDFKQFVQEKMVDFFDNNDKISLGVFKALKQMEQRDDLPGWISGREVSGTAELTHEVSQINLRLREAIAQNHGLQQKNERLERQTGAVAAYPADFDTLCATFAKMTVPPYREASATLEALPRQPFLDVLFSRSGELALGSLRDSGSPEDAWLFDAVIPQLVVHGLAEIVPHPRHANRQVGMLNPHGKAFLSKLAQLRASEAELLTAAEVRQRQLPQADQVVVEKWSLVWQDAEAHLKIAFRSAVDFDLSIAATATIWVAGGGDLRTPFEVAAQLPARGKVAATTRRALDPRKVEHFNGHNTAALTLVLPDTSELTVPAVYPFQAS